MRQSMLFAAIAAVFAAAPLQAAPINYGDFLGAAVGEADFLDVTEDSATDMTPLFESPLFTPNGLSFAPIAFTSSAANGTTDTTIATLTMTIRADAGFSISRIVIDQTADTTLSGAGGGSTFSSIATGVEIVDLDPGVQPTINDNVAFTPGDMFDLPPAIFSDINGDLVIDLTLFDIRELQLTLEHTLATGSEMGTTSFIQSKTFGIDVETSFIPEPSSIALIGLGALALIRRRTR